MYFGEIGENSTTLTGYFEQNGSRKFGADENPAEVMLEVRWILVVVVLRLIDTRSSALLPAQKQQLTGLRSGMTPRNGGQSKQHLRT